MTTDPSGLEQYSALARLAPAEKLELVATSKLSKFQVLEGPPAEVVVLMRFPSMGEALEWYDSDAYKKARPFRQAAAQYRAILIEGLK
jgi:uncharacterized protein (DUF1330 family)